ncbi:MAG: penicillin-binding protein 1A [Gammaproteobacteria bacterium]|jgi:penicillin-binding protein 1A|nr:penicillin-binding protein 1A [Gammaproteobacteria bacterium]
MSRPAKVFLYVLAGLLSALLALGGAGAALWAYLGRDLPAVAALKEVRLQVPLRVFTRDGRLIAEFGEMRRQPLAFEAIPGRLVQAVLAAEDDRFFEHPGFDWQGLTRAAWTLLRTGEKAQGGSTITMQVARNFFLSREKTYLRKLTEIILATRIEAGLSKREILALYLNKIYLGQRAYGVGAAAQVYYGKTVEELTLAETAMLAGLPKAPSRVNPISDPAGALARRNYVLGRMRELGQIADAEHAAAMAEPDAARLRGAEIEVDAGYAAEMARAEVVGRLGEEAYTSGYRVFTTLDGRLQAAADEALRQALLAYDERHGYRGPERRLPESQRASAAAREQLLAGIPTWGALRPAVVTRVEGRQLLAQVRGHGEILVPWEGLSWARPQAADGRRGPAPKSAAEVAAAGDLVRVALVGDGSWRLAQVPEVEGALAALAVEDGAIVALSGGFDFQRSQFNRAVQAQRQPGSAFKPFVYSAALDHGFTPASVVNDAPLVVEQPGLAQAWRPENASGKFYGPTRLREALAQSRNLVSIRLLRDVGVDAVVGHARGFGLREQSLPRGLSLALGTGEVTPLELAAGYAVFANGGFRVAPYLVQRVLAADGSTRFLAAAPRACPECAASAEAPVSDVAPRVISAQNAWLMTSMMKDVIRYGTARRALSLKRGDLAGKTGTTNEQRDAWFVGFNPRLVAAAWVGFDSYRPLGNDETGARAALPLWIGFMQQALAGTPEVPVPQPPGLASVRIDPRTGLLATADTEGAVLETFPAERLPTRTAESAPGTAGGSAESLF